ncbi:MAG: hypothetical protein H6628_12190 [Calditrichae bacterium]|nr:hypothetical protein [Calditrichia bacterium]
MPATASAWEVHLAVHESTEGELPRLRHPGAAVYDFANDPLDDQRIAVTTDLDQIFAGIGCRRFEISGHHLIDRRSGPRGAELVESGPPGIVSVKRFFQKGVDQG